MYNNIEKELLKGLSKNIQKQIAKLDELDIYTSRHIHSVPQIVNKICKKLNYNEEQTKFFIQCAYLHDIGKIFIPSEILQKKEKLTAEEYAVMKSHTIKGGEFCESIPSLTKYFNVACYHHENEDGSGYPKGIKNVPVEAEIIKVADMYDALVSKRQYKESIEIPKAIEILKEVLIDRHLVNKAIFKALLDVVIENENITDEEKKNIEKIKLSL